jgi:FPC/CPF motif-containing protein YcgG
MTVNAANLLIRKFQSQLQDKLWSGQNIQPTYSRYCMAGRMSESGPDRAILQFLHTVAEEANATPQGHINGIVLFAGPDIISQLQFDQLFKLRMQALQQLEQSASGSGQESPSPLSAGWMVKLIDRPFYVTGLHPTHRLRALRFPFPSLVFDTQPHIANQTARQDELYRQCLS